MGMESPCHDFAQKRKQLNGHRRINANHCLERVTHGYGDTQLLLQFTDQCLLGCFPRLHFSAGKFPQSRQVLTLGTEAREITSRIIPNHTAYHIDHAAEYALYLLQRKQNQDKATAPPSSLT